jgi:hypothetical protein
MRGGQLVGVSGRCFRLASRDGGGRILSTSTLLRMMEHVRAWPKKREPSEVVSFRGGSAVALGR